MFSRIIAALTFVFVCPVLVVATETTQTAGGVVSPHRVATLHRVPAAIASKTQTPGVSDDVALARWVAQFRQRALAAGISATSFDAAMGDVRYLKKVIERDRNQFEFSKTIWDYLDIAVSPKRVLNGKASLRKWRTTLLKIESRYRVDKEIIAAIWGLESAYGTKRGKIPVLSALATLSYDGRRGAFFETQLIAALKIFQNDQISATKMTGSWAGAMGHTQFMPSSFQEYAVDFTGDGKRDIWSDNPTDALASTAAYLAKFGWVKGMPWGVEVHLPDDFNYAKAQRKIRKMPLVWAQSGVVGVSGKPIPEYGKASVLLPAGANGAAFLVFQNFAALEAYNSSDAYVIAVGHLADRISGGGKIKAKWPLEDRALRFEERQDLQRLLTAKGFNTKGVDGLIGPLTIAAVRGFQRSVGLPADGYASLRILQRLRR